MKKISLELAVYLAFFIEEVIFHIVMFGSFSFVQIIRIAAFSLTLVSILMIIFHKKSFKTKKIVYFIALAIFSIYGLVEMQFVNFIGHFYSMNAVSDGFGVMVFVPDFVKTISPSYWLILIPCIICIACNKYYFDLRDYKYSDMATWVIIPLVIFLISFIGSNNAFKGAIKRHDSYDIVIENTGINAFFFEDLISSFIPAKSNEEEIVIETFEAAEEEETEEIQEVDYHRYFDDSELIKAAEEEENETFKTINSYILSRPIESKNEMTGIYEGKNFVYFMVESLDYIAIDKDLTPTLYKMHEEGYSFLNHYTPIYVCGTGDSEWVGMTGTFPTLSYCVAYNKTLNSKQSLAGLFKNAGYDTLAFHNWDDQFYPRSDTEVNYGFDAYYDYQDLGISIVNGWLSDRELVEKALPYFINSKHFFSFIITSTMHFPYDGDSYYGNKYLSEINQVHNEYPIEVKRYLSKSMEFDKSLELLLEELEKVGKLDNTVIAIYGDHHPKTWSSDTLIRYSTTLEKSGKYATDLLPFIIYDPSQKGEKVYDYCCNVDQLPTLANMFNLNYDPRLYAGSDIFTGKSVAMFPNGDWMSYLGYYSASRDSFESFNEEVKPSEHYWRNKNAEVSNMRKINQAMINSDYYRNYGFVINPKIIESK